MANWRMPTFSYGEARCFLRCILWMPSLPLEGCCILSEGLNLEADCQLSPVLPTADITPTSGVACSAGVWLRSRLFFCDAHIRVGKRALNGHMVK